MKNAVGDTLQSIGVIGWATVIVRGDHAARWPVHDVTAEGHSVQRPFSDSGG